MENADLRLCKLIKVLRVLLKSGGKVQRVSKFLFREYTALSENS